jgi:enoyl-CoA hydratase/carnithine racemase
LNQLNFFSEGGKKMKYATLLLEKAEAIVLLKLNLPEALNPMTREMGREFPQALEEIRQDPEIKGLILTGNGQAFSAGGNLKVMQQRTKTAPFRHKEEVRQFYRSFLAIRSLTIPTIAAVNGYAIGAGACLALACDLRIASEKAKFGFPFVKIGMHPGMGSTYLLPRAVGAAKAYELLVTGDLIDASEAYRIGLVNKVVKPEELMDAAREMAGKIAAMPMVAAKTMKESIYINLEEPSLEVALDREAAHQSLTFTTNDIQEGIAAAMEKRKAKFSDNI